MADEFFRAVVAQARALQLLSDEHFTVDGRLIEAWASPKSCRRKDAEPHGAAGRFWQSDREFSCERRSNATHQSATDPEARLCYSANALMENRTPS